jgi:hypothetical protein
VGFAERTAGQAGRDEAAEVGALQDVLVGTAQRVLDGFAGGLHPGDLLVELGQLAAVERFAIRARVQERLLLRVRVAGVAQEQDGAHQRDRGLGIASLA